MSAGSTEVWILWKPSVEQLFSQLMISTECLLRLRCWDTVIQQEGESPALSWCRFCSGRHRHDIKGQTNMSVSNSGKSFSRQIHGLKGSSAVSRKAVLPKGHLNWDLEMKHKDMGKSKHPLRQAWRPCSRILSGELRKEKPEDGQGHPRPRWRVWFYCENIVAEWFRVLAQVAGYE